MKDVVQMEWPLTLTFSGERSELAREEGMKVGMGWGLRGTDSMPN
jgi:hypothetical protein